MAARRALFQRSLEAYAQRPRALSAGCLMLGKKHQQRTSPAPILYASSILFPSLAVSSRYNSAQRQSHP